MKIMVWRSTAWPEIFNTYLKSYHCHVVTVQKVSFVVFIFEAGLVVFSLGLLWVPRCGDVSRGCKITAAGVRGAGAVTPAGSSCAMQGSFAPGEDGSCGSGTAAARSWEERILDECFGCTGMTWMFLELLGLKHYVLLGGVYHLLAVLERN